MWTNPSVLQSDTKRYSPDKVRFRCDVKDGVKVFTTFTSTDVLSVVDEIEHEANVLAALHIAGELGHDGKFLLAAFEYQQRMNNPVITPEAKLDWAALPPSEIAQWEHQVAVSVLTCEARRIFAIQWPELNDPVVMGAEIAKGYAGKRRPSKKRRQRDSRAKR